MKHVIAINGSPRSGWNTDILVRQAAAGAESKGAVVEVIDLYKLPKFTGCISCFGCKTENHLGECVCHDGLADVLEKIRNADGLIIGSPVYLGDMQSTLIAPSLTSTTKLLCRPNSARLVKRMTSLLWLLMASIKKSPRASAWRS